jgi:hypothetical protein
VPPPAAENQQVVCFYFSISQVAAAPQGHGRHAVTPADRPLALLIQSIQNNPKMQLRYFHRLNFVLLFPHLFK